MPLHSLPVSRRMFLKQSAAALSGIAVLNLAHAAETGAKTQSYRLALLSDTHIAADPSLIARNINMTDHLKQVVREVLAQRAGLSGVLINGDCAYNKGLPEDYVNFASLVQPLLDADLPLHLTMGNHDDHGPLYAAMASQKPTNPPVESKHVTVLETPYANLFLLDSQKKVNLVTGQLGEAQLAWLAAALDARTDKPAIIMAHHTPQFQPPAEGKIWGGIEDTAAFFELMSKRPHVKAFVYGHSHVWSNSVHNGIQLINLPAVAYVFNPKTPTGWVLANMDATGIQLTLNTIDKQHVNNQQVVTFNWS